MHLNRARLRVEIVKPHAYPIMRPPRIVVSGAIMKKGEIAHCVGPATLKEKKTVNLGYSGGSHGVSIPIPGLKIGGYPIRYYVRQSRGPD